MKNQFFFIFDQFGVRNIYYNLALEEAIAINLEKTQFLGGIRFWENYNSIVLGLSEEPYKNISREKINHFKKYFPNLLQSHKKIIDKYLYIARRSSGGGTVYHDLGINLNYSFFVSLRSIQELYPIKNSYQILLSFIIQALLKQNIDAKLEGQSDIVVRENGILKKISGNSQFRKKNCLTLHGTLMLSNDIIKSIQTNLLHPPKEPNYRKLRNHEDFITSLTKDFSKDTFKEDLINIFRDYVKCKEKNFKDIEYSTQKKIIFDAKNLYKSKYTSLEFILKE